MSRKPSFSGRCIKLHEAKRSSYMGHTFPERQVRSMVFASTFISFVYSGTKQCMHFRLYKSRLPIEICSHVYV